MAMMKKMAVFSALEPNLVPILFGEHFFAIPDWDVHCFTTDHGISGTFLDCPWPLFHYYAFPALHEQHNYDLLVYIIHRGIDAHAFVDLMDRWPGIVILETLDVHRERFRYFREIGRFHRYLGEMTALHGQRGLEVAKILLSEGEQHRLITQFSLVRAVLDGSLGIIVADRRDWLKLRRLYPRKPVIHATPASIAMGISPSIATADQPVAVSDDRKTIDQPEFTCGIVHATPVSLWKDSLINTFSQLCRESKKIGRISSFHFSRGHARRIGKDCNERRRKVIDARSFVASCDILILENYEASFFEDLLVAVALQHNIPVIAPTTCHFGDGTHRGIATVYPGRDELVQVKQCLEMQVKQLLMGELQQEGTQRTDDTRSGDHSDSCESRQKIQRFFASLTSSRKKTSPRAQELPMIRLLDPDVEKRQQNDDQMILAMVLHDWEEAFDPQQATAIYTTLMKCITCLKSRHERDAHVTPV